MMTDQSCYPHLESDNGSIALTPPAMHDAPKTLSFSFHYPIYAIGLSSSWLSGTDPTNKRFRLTKRVQIQLSTIPVHKWIGNQPAPIPPLWKHEGGSVVGLSSGAASAIIPIDETSSWKIKRCGLHTGNNGADSKRIMARIPSIRSESVAGILRFYEDEESLGGIYLDDAQHESSSHSVLASMGLCPAYDAIGCFDFGDGDGMLLCKVNSDLRADEYLMIIVWPLISDLIRRSRLQYSSREGLLLLRGVNACEELDAFPSIRPRLEDLGQLIGSSYRKLHDCGALRGIGNAWIGNDVIGSDGRLSFVDLDEFVSPQLAARLSYSQDHCEWEWRSLYSTLYSYFEYSSCYFLSYFAHIVAKAAQIAYHAPRVPIRLKSDIHKVIHDYISSRSLI